MPTSYLSRKAFTLIELLIVVAIIAILAAIAVPNFLEAQTRAKVSRVKADLRALATGIEAYRVDNNKYPSGSDNVNKKPVEVNDYFGNLAPGYYTLQTRDGNSIVAGRDFNTVTTPIAYVTQFFADPFTPDSNARVTYAYRTAGDVGNGYILTSFGPDNDAKVSLSKLGSGNNNMANPLSTAVDSATPARLGDINERAVIHFMENKSSTDITVHGDVEEFGGLVKALEDLSYDPTNGTVSDGDIYRVGP